MDRRVKSFILTIFGAALLLVVATMGCENPLLDTVKGEVSTFLEGDPEISIKKGIIDIPSGGEVDIGSAQVDQPGNPKIATFTVSNMGSGDLKLTGSPIIAIDTANPNEFIIGVPPYSTIASGTNSTFTIEFTPEGSAGARSAILSIDNNDSDENPYTFTITGTATLGAVPEIQVQQGSTIIDDLQPGYEYDFGSIEINTQANVEFTIYNIGTPDTLLHLTGASRVAIIGADALQFSVDPQPGTPIYEGSYSPFTVRYEPDEVSRHSATISIANNDSDEDPYEFTITGIGVIGLPKTGQTTSYATGDDGDLEMGLAWPSPRFTVGTGAESVCITDNLTGLMWEQSPIVTTRTWLEALIYANDLELGGHSDWRLPNVSELGSLINKGQADSAAWLNNVQGFSNVQLSYYWSSTTHALNAAYAWRGSMSLAYVNSSYKTNSYYVLAVRSGQSGGAVSLPKTGQTTSYATGDDGDLEMGVAWPSPRFTDNGNGTITDNLTGLMWDQTGNRFGTSTWEQALIDCNGLSLGGHIDWRLPNVSELGSLINKGQADSAAWLNNVQGFSNVQLSYYWSSTTHAPSTASAWSGNVSNGSVNNNNKTSNYYVLAVRSGQ